MKTFLVIIFSIPSLLFSQELTVLKATKQTINPGIRALPTTNYAIRLAKTKSFKWSVDSVIDGYTMRQIKYTFAKIDNPDAAVSNNHLVKSFAKKDKGVYLLTFAHQSSGDNRNKGIPMNLKAPIDELSQGIVIYYSAKNKTKQLNVSEFDVLETLNAP